MSGTMEEGSNEGAEAMFSDLSHDYFEELCAFSASGGLSGKELDRLERHLSRCSYCRRIRAEYIGVIATAIPKLAPTIGREADITGLWSLEQAEAALMTTLNRQFPEANKKFNVIPAHPGPGLRGWLYAAALFVVAAVSISYRIGFHLGRRFIAVVPASRATLAIGSQSNIDDSGISSSHVPEANARETIKTTELMRRLQLKMSEIARLREKGNLLEGELASRNADLDHYAVECAELDQKLSTTQSNLQDMQERLSALTGRKSGDATQSADLQTQVNHLSVLLQEKDRALSENEELLQHDHDIRNLIGARDLYIAEVYDVAKTGATQKPFGRVFYTKGKSLVFYAYDLDQQPGTTRANTFQAWGIRGLDQQHNINLGIFYQDDQNNKRWILKSSDPTILAQIDAVFVTVEPHGASSKPSGKPLLFTYLRMTPNHP
jgi:hypothetical protein